MRVGARVVATGVSALLLTACQQAVSPAAPTRNPERAAASAAASVVQPPPSPSAVPTLVVERVGASASPRGFSAFAVVSNPSDLRATEVAVDITAVDSNGATLARRTGRIAHITPGQREAVSVGFPVGRTLPSAFKGAVASVKWDSDASAELLEVAAATFVQDARTPSVRVHLIDHAPGAIRAALTAVCWDGAGNIRGGGTGTLAVAPGNQGTDFTLAVSIATVPVRCDAFGLTAS